MYSNENKMLGGSASEMLREMLSAAELARVLIAAYSAHRSTRHRSVSKQSLEKVKRLV